MRSIVIALGFLLSINAFAANTPPGFNKAAWDALVSKISAEGTVQNIEAGELHYLSVINPSDTSLSHHASYISTLVNYDSANKPIITDVSAVDEDWQTDGQGNWTINQWTYHTTVAGDLLSIDHTILKEHEGQVLADDEVDTGDITSDENMGRWGQLLGAWMYLATAQAQAK